uniref:Uncharacterized protein n=1 Tax=Solanum lycopersicum TaxID=4081 RepID=A0A3Q7JBH8_SOLLC
MFTLLFSLYFPKLRSLHKPSQPGWWSESNGNRFSDTLSSNSYSSSQSWHKQVFPEKNQSEVH